MTLVVRREKDKLVRYVHLATGNYNPVTARVYTDLGLLTAHDEIGEDATSLFNFLTGYSQQDKYKCLVVAPLNLRERLISMIRREAKNSSAGRPARIIIKCNSLTDELLIDELYRGRDRRRDRPDRPRHLTLSRVAPSRISVRR